MFETLKIIHMLALFGGGAAGIGNALLIRGVLASDGPPAPLAANTIRTLGRIGLASILLLWITGLWMGAIKYDGMPEGWAFWVKLVGATAVLLAVLLIASIAIRADRAGQPPDLHRIDRIEPVAGIGAVIATVFAVIAFN